MKSYLVNAFDWIGKNSSNIAYLSWLITLGTFGIGFDPTNNAILTEQVAAFETHQTVLARVCPLVKTYQTLLSFDD